MQKIPAPVISAASELVSFYETHATLDSLFMHAGAPGDPPNGSKMAKALDWLRITNQDPDVNALEVLGLIIEGYMDEEPETEKWYEERLKKIKRLKNSLAKANLRYITGGKIVSSNSVPAISLELGKLTIGSVLIFFEGAVEIGGAAK